MGSSSSIVLAVGLGSWFFISSRRDAREQALAAALTAENVPVGTVPANGGPSYPNEGAKADAVRKAFNSIISEDAGTEEAYAAEYYLGGLDVAAGKTDDGLKKYDHVISSAGADFSSLAKLAKAQVLFSADRPADAQTLLKDLIANPTSMVSKDQATMALAQGIAATQPDEARKLLLPLASSKSDISQAAVTAMAELPAAK